MASRTSELQQTADMLDLAYEELKHRYATGLEVFSLLANLRLPRSKQTNRQTIERVRTWCNTHGLDEASPRELVEGMVLARNLNADNGMLLLNAGKVLGG